jgi:aminoglycoside phosphotransferase (APT) family kinase protein
VTGQWPTARHVAERRTADLRALGAVVRSRLASVCEVWLQPIGTGKHNASYWVHADGCRYVLRVAPPDDAGLLFYERRMMRQEPALHALIRARTRVPVAEVVAHDFTRTQLDRDYVLLEALPGTALSEVTSFGPPQLDRVLFQVGEHLRQLHALTADDCLGLHAYGYLGAHRPMPPQPTWEAAFGMMWNLLLDDVVASGCYAPAEADRLRELYRQHHQHFQHPVEPRLLHMDVWAQNILVDELATSPGWWTWIGRSGATRRSSSRSWTTAGSASRRSGEATVRGVTGRPRLRFGGCSTCCTRCRSTCPSTSGDAVTRPARAGTGRTSLALARQLGLGA